MPTILILFEHLNPTHLLQLLPKNWSRVALDPQTAYIDVIVVDGKYNYEKRLYDIKSALKSRLDCPKLTNKVELHELLKGEETILPSWTISRWSDGGALITDHQPYIWRPENGWKGKGIKVITTQYELDSLRRDLETYVEENDDDTSRAVLSQYIKHPLLLHGHKMNVRLYLIIATHRRGAALLTRGLIGIAKKPYVLGKFNDMDIHDSRTLTIRDYRYPDDFPGDAKTFFDQAITLFDDVVRRVCPKSYKESKHGFEVLGCDLMMDTITSHVHLIEINHKPGHQQLDPKNQEWLSQVVCEGIAQFALSLPTPGIQHQYVRVGMDG